MRVTNCFAVLLLAVLGWPIQIVAQQTLHVEGYIRDAQTKESLPAVAIQIRGTTIGTATDENGHFALQATTDSSVLTVSYLGYETWTKPLTHNTPNRLDIQLKPVSFQLDAVNIGPSKERYSKKNNPAVAFIEQVIARREQHNPADRPYFSYDTYEQKTIAFNNVQTDTAGSSWMQRHVGFVFDYVDTSVVSGQKILPIFNEEIIESNYRRQSPAATRRVVRGIKRSGLIEVVGEEGMTQLLDEVFREVDIFQNNVPLLLNRFVSPVATFGPSYYKYYLLDTVEVDGERCVDVLFSPFTPEAYGFLGHLYVTLDSTFFIKKSVLQVPPHINLNFVDRMMIEQTYARTPDSVRLVTKNDIVVEFKISKNDRGLYARRIHLYRNHSFEPPAPSIFKEPAPVVELAEARNKSDAFWNKNREGAAEIRPSAVDRMMERLRRVPVFFWGEKVVGALINQYVQTATENSKLEIGPVNTFYSRNALEGNRFRLGMATTVNFSPRLFLEGYGVYGTLDRKLKGGLLAEYSFNSKKTFRREYPFHYLRAEYKYDVNHIGQHYKYTQPDNFFMIIKRRNDNLITYQRAAELSYYREHYNGWGYGIKARHLTEWATPDVPFRRIGGNGIVTPAASYRIAPIELSLRFAPNEKFYQSRNYRFPITIDAPIITLSHAVAQKGVLGSDYSYNRTDMGVRKRFWLSPFGSIDIFAQAGKVWDKVPYPLLLIPDANISYSIESETFALMDPMEFIHDSYVSWEMRYFMNGALFNRLPLIKKLQLREVFVFRGWYGELSRKNNPAYGGEGLYLLPENTRMMDRGPYMEFSAGISNIFKLLRLDYVWRLTYRDRPELPKRGLRFVVQFTF